MYATAEIGGTGDASQLIEVGCILVCSFLPFRQTSSAGELLTHRRPRPSDASIASLLHTMSHESPVSSSCGRVE